jgi:hypothetical protein
MDCQEGRLPCTAAMTGMIKKLTTAAHISVENRILDLTVLKSSVINFIIKLIIWQK